MELRDYQQELFNRIHNAIKRGVRNPLIVSATGSGKTALFCYLSHRCSQAGKNVLILVHRRELITQTSATLKKFGVHHGIIQPNITPDPTALVQLGMVQTITRRVGKLNAPDLIVTDEAHHSAASQYKTILQSFPRAVSIGFSATPARLDGKGLKDYFSEIIEGPSVEWLMENGFLCRPKYYAPPVQAQINGLKKRMGDFANDEIAAAMDKPTITGDAVKHYMRICNGSRAVVFCCNLAHAEHVRESFENSGITSGIIHGALKDYDRKKVVDDFASDRIKIMTAVDVISEGFDIPAMEAAILLRPTTSLALYLQQIGRALRPSDGKTAYILDHVGNIARHGLAETPREWSLDGIDKKKKASESLGMKQCTACFCLHYPAPSCPECDYVYPAAKIKNLTYIEGHLEEIKTMPLAKALAECKTRDDLKLLAKVRGYKAGFVYYKAKELNL
jgi:DNA repair protein RadD